MSTTPTDSVPRLYKILKDGASCHGGTATWPLPTADGPGAWMPAIAGALTMCENGYHLTREPARWWLDDATLYVAEYDGECVDDGSDKVCCRRVRLVRAVPWAEGQVYTDGEHHVRSGYARAWGSATVRASGSATVQASGSATVQASGSATVEAWGSATVQAWGSATVEAWDSATVRASGSATVWASDSATVRASGSATVRAWDSATVRASDSATVEAGGSATVEAGGSATVRAWGSATVRASGSATVISTPSHGPSAEVALTHLAAHVDRRGDGLVFRQAAPTVVA